MCRQPQDSTVGFKPGVQRQHAVLVHFRTELGLSMKLLPPVGHPNGGRLGNRKETTGCVTCKSGRQCGGYASTQSLDGAIVSRQVSTRPSTLPSPGRTLMTGPMSNSQERSAFGYFVSGADRAIAGPFDVELWSRLIPQLSQTIPALRYAAMAIGALLRRADDLQSTRQSTASPTLNKTPELFAVEQYQKAIQSTLHALDMGHGSPLLSSTTCVMFFCIEALQGHDHQALCLFERGRKAMLAPTPRNPNNAIALAAESTFSRLTVQWSMFNDDVMDDIVEVPDFYEPIMSIVQAQSELISLVTHAFDVCKSNIRANWADLWDTMGTQICPELKSRQESTNVALDHWRVRFEAYRENFTSQTETATHEIACSQLILWYNAISIWLTGSSVRSEMIYDSLLPQFRTLIAESGRALDGIEKQYKMVSFTFELGVIPPLYIAVAMCRHPALRRQALELLRRAPAQEGLWRKPVIVQACEKLIELEEGLDAFVPDIPEHLAPMMVPEDRRCKMVNIGLRATSENGRLGNYVKYYLKPYGLDGLWDIHEEFFAACN
ncbi:hypothetical protein FDECE_14490 [Fusarium decemcellulare]|nr:hypothetical protein FDECE_14490 [Fusarium decemcellulare]